MYHPQIIKEHINVTFVAAIYVQITPGCYTYCSVIANSKIHLFIVCSFDVDCHHSTGQGTGLGLSLSYDIIIKAHGGEIKVETKENEGSEFVVTIPA